eukprot:Nk52_evm46s153 gene=Nk52_evmTU46s153
MGRQGTDVKRSSARAVVVALFLLCGTPLVHGWLSSQSLRRIGLQELNRATVGLKRKAAEGSGLGEGGEKGMEAYGEVEGDSRRYLPIPMCHTPPCCVAGKHIPQAVIERALDSLCEIHHEGYNCHGDVHVDCRYLEVLEQTAQDVGRGLAPRARLPHREKEIPGRRVVEAKEEEEENGNGFFYDLVRLSLSATVANMKEEEEEETIKNRRMEAYKERLTRPVWDLYQQASLAFNLYWHKYRRGEKDFSSCFLDGRQFGMETAGSISEICGGPEAEMDDEEEDDEGEEEELEGEEVHYTNKKKKKKEDKFILPALKKRHNCYTGAGVGVHHMGSHVMARGGRVVIEREEKEEGDERRHWLPPMAMGVSEFFRKYNSSLSHPSSGPEEDTAEGEVLKKRLRMHPVHAKVAKSGGVLFPELYAPLLPLPYLSDESEANEVEDVRLQLAPFCLTEGACCIVRPTISLEQTREVMKSLCRAPYVKNEKDKIDCKYVTSSNRAGSRWDSFMRASWALNKYWGLSVRRLEKNLQRRYEKDDKMQEEERKKERSVGGVVMIGPLSKAEYDGKINQRAMLKQKEQEKILNRSQEMADLKTEKCQELMGIVCVKDGCYTPMESV